MKIRVACLVFALIAVAPRGAAAYSVLAHQSNIDALWEPHIRPALLARYPRTSEAALREARAHAYGGSVIQDLGYFPFGSKFFTNLLYYVKTGEFVETLMRDAQDAPEAEKLFLDSLTRTRVRYAAALQSFRAGRLDLPDVNFDTGKPAVP